MEEKKIRVLALADYCCATGFATVASNIMRELHKTGKYEIDVVGINYTGDPYDTNKFPGNVFPALNIANMTTNDPYGRQKFLDMLGTGAYDVVFILQDTFIVQTIMEAMLKTYEALPKKFKTILYYPFDATPKAEWVKNCVSLIDYPVPYTDYAKQLTLDVDPNVKIEEPIYHGTNIDDFYVIEDKDKLTKFRKSYFDGSADGRFLITNVNRNQSRKDIVRSFMILKELRRRGRKEPILYLHMSHNDVGGNLLVMADNFGLKIQEDFIVPHPNFFNVNNGVDVEIVNYIYNMSDMVLTTTLGEGWGLSVTEAMATKTPVVAPANTSLNEMLADDRGFLAKSGDTHSEWICLGTNDNERMRPLMNVDHAASLIEKIMDGTTPDIDKAYAWARQYTWEAICERWIELFDKAADDARASTLAAQQPSLNRNMRRAKKKKG